MQFSRLLSFAVIFFLGATFFAQEIQANDFSAQAQKKQLWKDPYWHKLLHIEPGLFGSIKSPVTSKEFFLSEYGKQDPESELLATIESMLKPEPKGDAHPLCRFPARAHWLKERLPGFSENLPETQCAQLDRILSTIQPDSLRIVYASTYLENPASTYGHLFLKLHQENMGLRNLMVQYAAMVGNANGAEYIFRGVFGGFDGQFGMAPQYITMKSNLELEDRDLFEVELDLNKEEIHRILLHLIEMQGVKFDYYFFKENCGYRLIELVETAWHEPPKIDKSRLVWSIPTDEFKILAKTVAKPKEGRVYLPSRSRRWLYRLQNLSEVERQWLNRVIKDIEQIEGIEFATLPIDSQAKILDVLNDHHRIILNDKPDPNGLFGASETQLEAWQKHNLERYKLLSLRSKLNAPPPVDLPHPVSPAESHGSALVQVSGWRSSASDAMELRLAAFHHDLLSDRSGQLPLANFSAARIHLRQEEEGSARLLEFNLFDLTAFNPRGEYFSPKSWGVTIGFVPFWGAQLEEPLSFEVKGRLGWTWGLPNELYTYLFGGMLAQSGTGLHGGGRIAGEGSLGLVFRPSESFGLHATASRAKSWSKDQLEKEVADLEIRWNLTKDFAFALQSRWSQEQLQGITLITQF